MAKKTENNAFQYTEQVTGEIVQIPVKLLHPHHMNPRKDLGDLTELTESIRANGVYQNLTVVPFWFEMTGVGCDYPEQQAEMGYLVVIGNRRLAAAKLAGLETLPCIIAKMTKEEQLQTMLLENMQRSDLTAYEQAQGFQLMMEMGSTVADVSEKTGFSETTIRRRLEWAKLDRDTMKEVSGRQISFGDLDKLSQIDDIETRNKVLCEIGTHNFENRLQQAIQAQKDKEREDLWRTALVDAGATEVGYSKLIDSYRWIYPGYYNLSDNPEKAVESLEEGEKYYFALSYHSVYIRAEPVQQEEKSAEAERLERERAEFLRKKNEAEAAFTRAYQLRVNFVNGLTEAKIKKQADKIIAAIVRWNWSNGNYGSFCFGTFADCVGVNYSGASHNYDDVKDATETSPYKALLGYALARWNDSEDNTYMNYQCRPVENKSLDLIYELLMDLGYERSDEEIDLMEGTSELYIIPEDPEDDGGDF